MTLQTFDVDRSSVLAAFVSKCHHSFSALTTFLHSSSQTISFSGRRCPNVSAKLMPACGCLRIKRFCDVFHRSELSLFPPHGGI